MYDHYIALDWATDNMALVRITAKKQPGFHNSSTAVYHKAPFLNSCKCSLPKK